MNADLVIVSVPGADASLQAAQIDGRAFVAFRPLCDALGVAYSSQLQKLRGRSWATVLLNNMVAADRVSREMALVDRKTMAMWLATLDERRVSPDARDRVVAFQAEAADALDAYFNHRGAAPAMNQLDVLRAALDQIEAAQRDAAEAREIAQRTDDRLAAIEGKHDWFAALGSARQAGLPTSTRYLAKLGKCAASIARQRGITPNPVQHQLYGTVNSFPAWVWDLAAEGFDA